MAEDVTYAYYPVYSALPSRGFQDQPPVDLQVQELESLFKRFADRVAVRGTYDCQGFRSHTDFLWWWVAHSPDDIQELSTEIRRTAFGRGFTLQLAFLGAVRPPEFNPQHLPAFLRGEEPRKYLCVYPFVRTAEWYLMPAGERAALLREHGELGREFPDVLPNTTSAFGLGDWEWILAFEADELHRIVDCIRRLRDSATRRYTKEETPFVIGIRKELREAIADLA
jgi:hydrogen peroxide-dependent heme synthase